MMIEKYDKRWVLLSALLSLSTMMKAADKNAVRVYEANGNSVTYLLSECPSTTFSGDTLILKAGDVEVSYPLNPSVRFEFVESSEESTDIQNAKSEPLFKITGNQISIFNIRPNSIANIYDLSGQALKSELSDSEGRIVMDVLNLPHGTYVIKSEQVTFKILIK